MGFEIFKKLLENVGNDEKKRPDSWHLDVLFY